MKPVCVVPMAFALCAEQQQLGQAAVTAGPEVPGRFLAQGMGRHVWSLGRVHPLSPLPGGCVALLKAAPWGAALSCMEPARGLHPLPTPGGSWQSLPPGLLTAQTNGGETPRAGGPFVSPRCLRGCPFQLGSRRRAELSARVATHSGEWERQGEGTGGLTGRAQFAGGKAACNGLGVGVWQRLGSAYSCCCSLCSPAPFPLS